jgi:hypothetical protein
VFPDRDTFGCAMQTHWGQLSVNEQPSGVDWTNGVVAFSNDGSCLATSSSSKAPGHPPRVQVIR